MPSIYLKLIVLALTVDLFIPSFADTQEGKYFSNQLRRQCHVSSLNLRRRLSNYRGKLSKLIEYEEIHPSNYGSRQSVDIFGQALSTEPTLVVIHETVYGIGSALETFRTEHKDLLEQASYHVLIAENGTIVQLLDPSARAFGAGNSSFKGKSVQTNLDLKPSVNNFSLHISLETPLDGEDNDPYHSGYSSLQYDSLALLIANWMKKYGISFENITTHKNVDQSGERLDPRSFRWKELQIRLAALGMLC